MTVGKDEYPFIFLTKRRLFPRTVVAQDSAAVVEGLQKGRFLERVLISPRTEKALAAAVTKLIAPMARVACGRGKNTIVT